MASTGRRESLISVLVSLGLFGFALCVAADLLLYDSEKNYEACAGKRPKSWAPYLGSGALLPFMVAMYIGNTRSKRAVKTVIYSRFFLFWRKDRSFRARIVIPFLLQFCLISVAVARLEGTTTADFDRSECGSTKESMASRDGDIHDGEYSTGGSFGFAAIICTSLYFMFADMRKIEREKLKRRYTSSNFYAEDIETDGETDEEFAMDDIRGNTTLRSRYGL